MSLRQYLSRLLDNYGLDVVLSSPLEAEHLLALNPEDFDVLLIDRETGTAKRVPDLEFLLARWPGPVLYNDTQAMKTNLRRRNYDFGKSLAREIEALARSSGARTGT